MAITSTSFKDFDVQVLTETIQGAFQQKTAFMGSVLVSQGAVTVADSMPNAGPNFIGTQITVPYFGTIGNFVNNPDGSAVSTNQMAMTNEIATISRSSLAFEVSRWAQNAGPTDADPYEEASRQIVEAAIRDMDARLITESMNTALVSDIYSSSSPAYISWDAVVDARAKWGDENRDVVAMICHSRTMADLRKLKDTIGRPLLVDSMQMNDVPRFAGVPVIESDRAPLTGSSMSTVTSAGTSPPTLTLAGTPTGAWQLRIQCTLGGANATAKIRFSTDGGNTWSASIVTAAANTTFALTDTAADSLVGQNGVTGLTASFASGTFNTDNTYSANAILKATTLIVKKRAMAFWYSRNNMDLVTLPQPLAHTELAAMHLYGCAHLYRRTPGGTRPGVVALKHNISGFTS